MKRLVAVVICALVPIVSCAKFGYTDRVLHRVPAPGGQLVAVCQEVPMFDGPEFEVRLERPDGRLVRPVHHMGDGGGCDELAWSADGRMLVVLTSHLAGITVVDVAWASSHPGEMNRHWFVRGFSFSTDRMLKRATGLAFVSRLEVEFQFCEYSLGDARRAGGWTGCRGPTRAQRLRIPEPLVPNRPI